MNNIGARGLLMVFNDNNSKHTLNSNKSVQQVSVDYDSDWRSNLSNLEVPISVEKDPLLVKALSLTIEGRRISKDMGAKLFREADSQGLSSLANLIKVSRFGNYVFFNENLHVNITNVCTLACRFCAFRRGSRHIDAYSLSPEEFVSRIKPFSHIIDEVHAVGGLHPEWTVSHYSDIYQLTKQRYPNISIKSLTAVEVKHLASRSGLSISDTLSLLHEAGLDSLPGGGAEILVDSVRDRICRGKEKSSEYLEIHHEAHMLGIPTNCTMLFGTVETIEDMMTHLDKLRKQQDNSSGFQCFVPYPFLKDNTRLPEARLSTANEILRVISISRIMLDNIPHLKAYRMNIGDHLAEIAIHSGADDIDGTVGHEEIMHEAGSTTSVDYDAKRMQKLVKSTGLVPVKRNSTYNSFVILDEQIKSEKMKLPIAGQ